MMSLPNGSVSINVKVNKKDFLKRIKKRFNDEIGVIIKFISTYNNENGETKGKIGFWAEFRLLFPVIETIAKVCNIDRNKLLKDELNIETPVLFWNAYRHPLTHNDWLYTQKLGNRNIYWGITLDAKEQYFSNEEMLIDPGVLYKDIDIFLNKKINETKDSEIIELDLGVEYKLDGVLNKKGELKKPQREVIEEFELLINKKT